MTDTFTVSINGTETTRSDGYDAELNALALGPGLYSNSLAFGYCYDIVCYCEVDNYLWGFTVWRTVYSLGSDAKFARALDIINQWVESECFEEVDKTHTDTGAEDVNYRAAREVWKRYENVVIEDRSLEGASPDAVRKKFAAWTESKGVDWRQ